MGKPPTTLVLRTAWSTVHSSFSVQIRKLPPERSVKLATEKHPSPHFEGGFYLFCLASPWIFCSSEGRKKFEGRMPSRKYTVIVQNGRGRNLRQIQSNSPNFYPSKIYTLKEFAQIQLQHWLLKVRTPLCHAHMMIQNGGCGLLNYMWRIDWLKAKVKSRVFYR